MSRKRSAIWQLSLVELKTAIEDSVSYTEILRKTHIPFVGSAIRTLKARLDYEGIDHTHIQNNTLKHGSLRKNKLPLSSILVEGSTYRNTSNLKARLLRGRFLEYRCQAEGCSLGGAWNGKDLVLQLDHINGVRDDNRLENLRLLCPNRYFCWSAAQKATFF